MIKNIFKNNDILKNKDYLSRLFGQKIAKG